MTLVHIPYAVEQDLDGVWCADAEFVTDDVRGGAHGYGDTKESAVADLREALEGMVEEFGVPHSAQRILAVEVADVA